MLRTPAGVAPKATDSVLIKMAPTAAHVAREAFLMAALFEMVRVEA
jgi:hypothetical protein